MINCTKIGIIPKIIQEVKLYGIKRIKNRGKFADSFFGRI